MTPRAFISFEMEDMWARDFLAQHAKDEANEIQFVDYSVQDPWDSSWKTHCKERIAQTRGTIVLIGPTTHKSEAVLWEIQETLRQGHAMFAVQTRSGQTYSVPLGLSAATVIRWNFDQIVKWLGTWG